MNGGRYEVQQHWARVFRVNKSFTMYKVSLAVRPFALRPFKLWSRIQRGYSRCSWALAADKHCRSNSPYRLNRYLSVMHLTSCTITSKLRALIPLWLLYILQEH